MTSQPWRKACSRAAVAGHSSPPRSRETSLPRRRGEELAFFQEREEETEVLPGFFATPNGGDVLRHPRKKSGVVIRRLSRLVEQLASHPSVGFLIALHSVSAEC